MDLSALSKQQLAENLRDLQQSGDCPGINSDRLHEVIQDLQVHRVELEMQNRSLRDMQAEVELAMRRYADLYDNLPVGYITVTPDGQVVQANLAAAELLQRDRSRLIGGFLRSFLDAYDAGRFAAHLESCVQSGRAATIDLTVRPKDGSSVIVQLSSRVAPVSDTARHILVALTDVSKLKQVQRIMEEINREQEAFNYSISHDLRAPLVTINNYASIVLSDHGASMDAAAKAMVERIRCAAQRMEDTLKHLLQYSTLAREEIVLQPVSVESVVADLLVELRATVEETRAEIVVERPLPVVRGARVILAQVLANLLTNALKYTNPGESPHVRIFAESGEHDVVVKVADRGIGIDSKYHERIFKVFERLHGYSRYPGSGVGLAIARRAMERMNGRIWVESEPGKGSCFCLRLPKG